VSGWGVDAVLHAGRVIPTAKTEALALQLLELPSGQGAHTKTHRRVRRRVA
jgi:hypothetical protein